MWLVHEGSGMLMNVAHGIMLAVIGVAIMSIALPTVSRIMSNNDTIIQNFCNSYEKNQKIKWKNTEKNQKDGGKKELKNSTKIVWMLADPTCASEVIDIFFFVWYGVHTDPCGLQTSGADRRELQTSGADRRELRTSGAEKN